MDDNLDTEIRLWQEKLFARSIRRRRKLDRIRELVGKTSNLHCLEISSGDGFLSAGLRELGGSWKTVVASETAAESVASYVPEKVSFIENGKLPFEDQGFNLVVIIDALKGFADDYGFIRECHRVLKNDGWVVVSERRRIPFSLVALLQRILGVSPVALGAKRNGYKVTELFNILKDGFDVPETIVYSNSLLEAASAVGEFAQKSIAGERYWLIRPNTGQEMLYRYRRLHALAGAFYPLSWILSTLEFLPGHQFLFKSRRRHWRPRLSPKLVDGRSIAEAAINTKIGTAAPF